MLPYKNRLIHKKDFEKVYRYGASFSCGNIFVKFGKNETDQTRIGFSVGIKVSKSAVERNKIKRKLREVIHKSLNKIKPGFDLVVMVRKNEKKGLVSQILEKDMEGVLEKGNLISK